MTRFYAMLNAEKITTGKKKFTAELQLKIRILLLKKKKKRYWNTGKSHPSFYLSSLSYTYHQQKHALKQTGTVLQLLFHGFSDGGWTLMWEKCIIGPKRLSGRESLCYVMLRGKTTQKHQQNRKHTTMPRAFKILSLHIGQVQCSLSQGSTQDLWKTCLLKKKKGRIISQIISWKTLRSKCK